MKLDNDITLSQEVERGVKLFYTNVLVTLVAVFLSFILTITYSGSYPKSILVALAIVSIIAIVMLFIISAQLNMPQTKVAHVLDTRIFINLREGSVLPSPSSNYSLQTYAYQLYKLLDKCNLVDRDVIRRPPNVTELRGGKLNFITELLEESLLRIIASQSYDCLRYCGDEVVSLDLVTIVKPRFTTILSKVKKRCGIKDADAGLLRILTSLPNSFNISVKRVGKPNNLFEIIIKSRYCSLKIKVLSYSWLSQVKFRRGPIPTLAEMPISSTTIDYYLRLLKMGVGISRMPFVAALMTEGIIGVYNYHTEIEMEYSSLYAILNSKRTVPCLRYIECLVKQLRSHGDWKYRVGLDYRKIYEEEVLSAIKRVEANLSNLIEQIKSCSCKE